MNLTGRSVSVHAKGNYEFFWRDDDEMLIKGVPIFLIAANGH